MVNFLIRQDKRKTFLFAALQSEAGKKILTERHLSTHFFDSMIFVERDRLFKSSSAVLKIYGRLPWYWKWTQLFWIVPKFLRDAIYNAIARRRYKWFGKKDQCMVPGPEIRSRFLS
jgi:predicted DCC family thiol-disulfide oxidoreductase YuxK